MRLFSCRTHVSVTQTDIAGRLRVNAHQIGTNDFMFPATRGTTGQVLASDGMGGVNWTTISAGGGGTLDAAYDFGGAGSGRSIIADAGVVAINGVDGFVTTGCFVEQWRRE